MHRIKCKSARMSSFTRYLCMVYFKFLEPAIFQLSKEYDKREKAIKSCVGVLSQKVNALRKEREENMDDFDLMRKLRKEQTKVNIFMNSNFNSY